LWYSTLKTDKRTPSNTTNFITSRRTFSMYWRCE